MTRTQRDALVGLFAAILTAAALYLAGLAGVDVDEAQVQATVTAGLEAVVPDADTDSDPHGVPVVPLGD